MTSKALNVTAEYLKSVGYKGGRSTSRHILMALARGDKSQAQVAQEFGRHVVTVRRIVQTAERITGLKWPRLHRGEPMTPKEEAIVAYAEEHSRKETAEHFGVPLHKVGHLIDRKAPREPVRPYAVASTKPVEEAACALCGLRGWHNCVSREETATALLRP